MKKIVAINCSPRVGWNTDTLVKEAAKGAEEQGAEVQVIELYKLEKFTGCVSCFGCKLPNNLGKCVCNDGLKPVLDAIREADGLIIGSPVYLGDVSSGFRALFERLIFQSLTYKREIRSYNTRKIPVMFILTSNVSDAAYENIGYDKLIARYRQSLETFVGNVKVFVCGNTLQVKNYDLYNWTNFNPEDKIARRETVFPQECQQAYTMGQEMTEQGW